MNTARALAVLALQVAGIFSAFLMTATSLHAEMIATPAALPPCLNGLDRANHFRAMVNLPPLTYDPASDTGDYNHARYIVKNHVAGVDFNYADGVLKRPARDWARRMRTSTTSGSAAAVRMPPTIP